MTPWLQDADVTLYHGDALAVLRELPSESVDCCVTSPPYWGLRDYGNEGQLGLEPTPEEYVIRMVEVFREVRRVLAAHGTVWLNLGDSFAGHNLPGWRPGNEPKNTGVSNKNGVGYVAGLKPKDLVGIPWRVAFALQADGWYLRSDIIWAKPNPMPESVTDRPTKAHEYVFLLSKQSRYFFDAEAVREPSDPNSPFWRTHPNGQRAISRTDRLNGSNEAAPNTWLRNLAPITDRRPQEETLDGSEGEAPRGPDGRRKTTVQGANGSIQHRDGERWPNGGRNIRSVWEIATQPYPEAHFATFPEELARRCIAAGTSEKGKCPACGAPWVREVEVDKGHVDRLRNVGGRTDGYTQLRRPAGASDADMASRVTTVGWQRPCKCTRYGGHDGIVEHRTDPGVIPAVVLDPFIGSGTVAHVARKLGRHAMGIDLSEEYLKLAARRLQQQSLFAEPAA